MNTFGRQDSFTRHNWQNTKETHQIKATVQVVDRPFDFFVLKPFLFFFLPSSSWTILNLRNCLVSLYLPFLRHHILHTLPFHFLFFFASLVHESLISLFKLPFSWKPTTIFFIFFSWHPLFFFFSINYTFQLI